MGLIMRNKMEFPVFASKMEPYKAMVVEEIMAPVMFSMDEEMTAGERLRTKFGVPVWQIPLFSMADSVRFGAYFMASNDPTNMDRRLAGINANGKEWKGNPRAAREDYLMYLDRIMIGRTKPKSKYCAAPTIQCDESRNAEVIGMIEMAEAEE